MYIDSLNDDVHIQIEHNSSNIINEHQPLDIILHENLNNDTNNHNNEITLESFIPSLHNGEYTYALTTSNGIIHTSNIIYSFYL